MIQVYSFSWLRLLPELHFSPSTVIEEKSLRRVTKSDIMLHSKIPRIDFPVARLCFDSHIDGLTGSSIYSFIFDVSTDCHLYSGAGKKIHFQDKR